MDKHLESIGISYDKAVSLGKKGIDLYRDLPAHITNDTDYLKWEMEDVPAGSRPSRLV